MQQEYGGSFHGLRHQSISRSAHRQHRVTPAPASMSFDLICFKLSLHHPMFPAIELAVSSRCYVLLTVITLAYTLCTHANVCICCHSDHILMHLIFSCRDCYGCYMIEGIWRGVKCF